MLIRNSSMSCKLFFVSISLDSTISNTEYGINDTIITPYRNHKLLTLAFSQIMGCMGMQTIPTYACL